MTIEPALIPKLLWLSVIIFLFIVGALFQRELLLPKPHWIFAAWGGIIITHSISLFYTQDTGANLLELSRWLAYGLLIIYLLHLYRDATLIYLKDLNAILVITSLLFGFYGLIQLITVLNTEHEISHKVTYSITGVFMNRNIFMQFLGMSLPFVFKTAFSKGKLKYLAMIAFALSMILIVICQTRSVWIALILSSIIVLATTIRFQFISKKQLLTSSLITIGLIVISVGFYSMFGDSKSFGKQIESSLNYRYSSVEERMHLWSSSLKMVSERPFLGYGVGSWKLEHMKYGMAKTKAQTGSVFYQRPHNDFLWIASELGIPTLIFYLLLFGIIIQKVWKLEGDRKVFRSPILYSIIFFLIVSSFSFTKERVELGLVFLLIISPVFFQGKDEPTFRVGKGLTIISAFLLLASIVQLFTRFKTEVYIKGLLEYSSNESKQKLKNPMYQFTPTSTPISWLIGYDHFRKQEFDSADLYFEKAYQTSPYNVQILNSYGVSMDRNNNHPRAKQVLSEAIRIAPKFEEAYLNLSMLYFQEGELDTAGYYFLQVEAPCTHPNYLKLKKLLDL